MFVLLAGQRSYLVPLSAQSEPAVTEERRIAPRRILRTRVQVVLTTGPGLSARSLNISSTGMAVIADAPIASNTTLALRCLLPLAGAMHEFVAQAQVMHSVFSSAEGGFIVGVRFLALSPPMAALAATVAGGA